MADELEDLTELVIGQTYEKALEFRDESDTAIPLFGSTLYFLLKDSPRNDDVDAALSVTVVPADDQASQLGKATLVVNSDDWTNVVAKQYYWSLIRVVTADSPQSVYPHSSGRVNVVKASLSTFA